MTIEHTETNNELFVTLNGRLDSITSGDLDTFLNEHISENTQSLTLDFANVDFISSKGLRVLVAAYKNLNGKPFNLINTNTSVVEVLKLSGLLKIFNVQ